MTFWNDWWAWLVACFVFVILEAFVPGYAFLGLAIGAAIIAATLPIMEALGFPVPGLVYLLMTCSVIALISWFLMRRFFSVSGGKVKVWKRDINQD